MISFVDIVLSVAHDANASDDSQRKSSFQPYQGHVRLSLSLFGFSSSLNRLGLAHFASRLYSLPNHSISFFISLFSVLLSTENGSETGERRRRKMSDDGRNDDVI
ncbi:hypothetical protein Ancab_031351 [Ancistrocladus abbreviatus]